MIIGDTFSWLFSIAEVDFEDDGSSAGSFSAKPEVTSHQNRRRRMETQLPDSGLDDVVAWKKNRWLWHRQNRVIEVISLISSFSSLSPLSSSFIPYSPLLSPPIALFLNPHYDAGSQYLHFVKVRWNLDELWCFELGLFANGEFFTLFSVASFVHRFWGRLFFGIYLPFLRGFLLFWLYLRPNKNRKVKCLWFCSMLKTGAFYHMPRSHNYLL